MTAQTVDQTAKSAEREACGEPLTVCFVCTGNTCRSPMAAAVANAWAQRERKQYPKVVADAMSPVLKAFSRGLYAADGDPISQNARLALEEAGVAACADNDYRCHLARTIGEEDVRVADLLVAVGPRHAMELLVRFPWAAGKIACMPEAIDDPFGGDLAVYRACLAQICSGVEKLLFSKELEQ